MRTQPSKTRDYFMGRARQARAYLRRDNPADMYGFEVFKPVAYYVAQARRANRQHVQNKMWSNML